MLTGLTDLLLLTNHERVRRKEKRSTEMLEQPFLKEQPQMEVDPRPTPGLRPF